MVTNAAKELLELFDGWKHELQSSNPTVLTQRGNSPQLNEHVWRNQLTAVKYLLDVEAFIEFRGEERLYAEFLAALRSFVFVPGQAWSQGAIKLEPSTRLSLHQLGQLMDTSAARILHLSPPQVDALQEAIDECLEILDSVAVTDDKGLQYLRELLTRLKEALERGDVEFPGIRDKAYAAFGVAVLHRESLPEESRRDFFKNLSKVVFPFASGTATGASGNLLGSAIEGILQLGA